MFKKPAPTPILDVRNVRQAFKTGFWMKTVEILHGISFSVPEKAVFGFLGPNGAGKTTLIHLIAGLKKPVFGEVRIGGHPADSAQARQLIGYLPERPYFYDHLTGEKFLQFYGRLSGMPEHLIAKRIPKVLEQVGMFHARSRELRKYSKGMLQRIGIAQAILHDPKLLILDEPVSGLDPNGRKEIRELMLQLAQEGKTVFFSSHIIPDVEAICDSVAIIRKGELVGCGPIGEFLSQGKIQTEVAFSGVAPSTVQRGREKPAFVSVREMPDGVRAVVQSQDEVEWVVRKVLDEKGKLLWVTPIRPSLESWFNEDEIQHESKNESKAR